MSKFKLREEKNCLNCGSYVADRFCPHCGQENVVNHPSFTYLFTHFTQDFLHYDSGFWLTLKTLLFKPGKIIKEFLEGKRKTYMPPVKLYIFISFVTFFIPYILPDFDEAEDVKVENENAKEEFKGIYIDEIGWAKNVRELDSIQNALPEKEKLTELKYKIFKNTLEIVEKNPEIERHKNSGKQQEESDDKFVFNLENEKIDPRLKNANSVREFDSIYNQMTEKEKNEIGNLDYFFVKKDVELKEKKVSDSEYTEMIEESLVHNFPKVLFFYLPLFAFFLWLFHHKGKWVYYDHGVFTLYYFSLLLILSTIFYLLGWTLQSLNQTWSHAKDDVINTGMLCIFLPMFLYAYFYFFRAHHIVYGEDKWMSRLKSFFLFLINSFVFILILILYTAITIYIV